MDKLSLKDLDVKDKKVLMRVDFNVPQDANQNIADDTRIRDCLPSIQYVLDQGGKLILMSHLGSPKGKKDPLLSLKDVAEHLSKLLKKPVQFCDDCIGVNVELAVNHLKSGEVLLLENLRFYPEEEKPEKNPEFAKSLSHFGDLFINEAFGSSHRSHSSTVMVPKYFPEKAAAGFLLEKEMHFLDRILTHPQKPFYSIVGGSKISSKLGVIKELLKKADAILIGGGMAYTFLKAQGFSIGSSICEDDLIEEAKQILETAKSKKVEIVLPVDHIITDDLKGNGSLSITNVKQGIPAGFYGVDIGPSTVKSFSEKLRKAKTVLWNGPLGVFEIPKFAKGTKSIAETLASLSALTIVGGGDSIAALEATGLKNKMSYVSTGGGALLEYIEYGSLPGIDSLTDKK